MSATATQGPYPSYYHDDEARRWLFGGLAAMFVLIGLAVAAAAMGPMMRGGIPNWPVTFAPGDWLLQLIVVVVAIWVVVWIFRLLFWGIAGPAYAPYRYSRHAYRDYYRQWPNGPDPAVAVARERFARGEISRDQLDQIVRDLGHLVG